MSIEVHFITVAKVVSAIPALQLIGVSMTGLEPEFQPVVNHLLPHIISHKQDAHDMHLQVDHIINTVSIILYCVYPTCIILFLCLLMPIVCSCFKM